MRRALALLAVAAVGLAALAGCSGRFPADAAGTLDAVEASGVLVVGVTEDEAHIDVRDDAAIEGDEAELVRVIAASLGAEARFVHGSESDMVQALERGDVQLVAGGFADDTPWQEDAAMTRPYGTGVDAEGREEKLVLLARRGENAFLVAVERALRESGHEA